MKSSSFKLFFYKESQLFKKVVIEKDFLLMIGSDSSCDIRISIIEFQEIIVKLFSVRKMV